MKLSPITPSAFDAKALAVEAKAAALVKRLDKVADRLDAVECPTLSAMAREYAGFVRGNPGGFRRWLHWADQLEGAALSGEHEAARAIAKATGQ